jgi:signal transduction histidine kinase
MNPSNDASRRDIGRVPTRTERLLACFQKALGHELPNQLVAVQGLVQLLREEEAERLSPEGRECLQRLAGVVQRAHALVRELADVGRAVRGQDAGPGEACLREAAQEVLAEVKQLSPAAPIEYHVLDPGTPLPFSEASLRQVLGGLLRHAVRRRAPDRPLRLEVGARNADGAVELWLADDGPALSPAEQRQPFEPFLGADQGLGLLLSALLVDGWGGVLRVRSEPGAGTRYTAVIPLRP